MSPPRRRSTRLIRDFAARGGGVLVRSSDLAELARLCDRDSGAASGTDRGARSTAPHGFDESGCTPRSAVTMAQSRSRVNLAGQMPLITLIALCVVTALLTDRFLSPLNLTNILVQSSIMAVIAIGMTFVIIGGGFDLSVGSTVALAGCIAAMMMVKFGIAAGVARRHRGRRRWSGWPTASIIAKLGVNPFITTLGTMVLVRGLVYPHHRRRAGRRRGRACRRFIAFGSGRLLGIHYLVWVPGVLLVRAVLRDARDALWTAHLRHRRQPRGGLSVRRAGRAHHRLDLCVVRRARRASPASCSRRACNRASPPPASSTS